MAFASFKFAVASRWVWCDRKDEIVHDSLFAPIIFVRLVPDHRVFLIRNKREGTSADWQLVKLFFFIRFSQKVCIFGRMDAREIHRQIGNHGDVGLFERHANGHRIKFFQHSQIVLEAHVREIVIFAARDFRVRMRVFPLPLKREQYVVCVEITRWLKAIHTRVEFDPLAQLEGKYLAVWRHRPALGQTWLYLRATACKFSQLVINRARSVKAGARRIDRWGKVLWRTFRAIDQGLCRSSL